MNETAFSSLVGRAEGKNYSGRPRLAYIKQIMKDVGCTTYVVMKKS
jgi:glucose-6-phosphate dehydrogenase assembly protein OpcA